MNTRWLYLLTLLLALATFVVAVGGAVEVSVGAKAGHAYSGPVLGLLAIAVAALHRSRLSVLMLVSVVIAGISAPFPVLHALAVHLALASQVLLLMPSTSAEVFADTGTPSMRTLGAVLPAVIASQAALGAAFRHKMIGILPHIGGAFVAAILASYVAIVVFMQYSGSRPLRRAATGMLSAVSVQLLLGVAAFTGRLMEAGSSAMVWLTVLHVAFGALTVSATAVMSMEIYRSFRPASATEAAAVNG